MKAPTRIAGSRDQCDERIRISDPTPDVRIGVEPGTCIHCRLPVPEGSDDARFCCVGCRVVFHLIQASELDRFYALGGGEGQPVGRPPQPSRRDWLVELLDRGRLPGGQICLSLDVQGIHCAACVWLLTELWRRRDGALHVDLNPSLGRISLMFEPDTLDLVGYLDEVERLGYRFAPPNKSGSTPDRGLLIRLGVCAALAMNAMMFAFAEYLGMGAADGAVYTLFQWLSFGISTLAVVIGGPVFFRAAFAGMRRRVVHLDQPISLGIALAWAGSTYEFLAGSGESYFDTVTVFVALMLFGRFLQQRAVHRNRRYLLENTGAEDLRVRVIERGGIHSRPLSEVRAGDRIMLSTGDLVPTPCRLVDGAGAFSLDWINGESEPRYLAPGATVPAGAFLRSSLAVRLEALVDVADSGLLQLLATPTGARDDRVASRFWTWLNRGYVLTVLLLAVAAATVWMFVDSSRALEVAISVLVVTCPCALGLATPLAFDLALARLRRGGVYVRTTNLLDKARRVRNVVFDKTGTLTWGDLDARIRQPVRPRYRDLLLTMAHSSGHPVSRSIAAAVQGDGEFRCVDDLRVEEVPGAGLVAHHGGAEFRLGAAGFARGDHDAVSDELSLFTRNGHVEASFAIEEDVRDGFRREIERLRDDGQQVFIFSGDRPEKVRRVARAVGVPLDHAVGDLSPSDKAVRIREMDHRDTMMIGDGLNDAPAFEAAWCAGAAALDRPVMPSRADFFFLGGGSAAVRSIITAGRRLRTVVITNLWLAGIYNLAALTFCFLGLMTPLLCAVLMPLSSLVLVWHTAARLRA
jgi:P-type Cu2+ transporter